MTRDAEHIPSPQSVVVPVDDLAQEIRRVDGNHSLGAGALAEALLPFLSERLAAAPAPEAPAREGMEDAGHCLRDIFSRHASRAGDSRAWSLALPDNSPDAFWDAVAFDMSALTPRHEAPTSPAWRDEYNRVEAIREAAEGQDRIARSTADPIAKSDAETQAAGHWTRYEREVAKLNAASGHEAPASEGEREPLCMAYKTGYAEGVEDSNGMFDRESCEEGWGQYAEKLSAQPALPARLPLPTVDDGRGGRRPINPQDDR